MIESASECYNEKRLPALCWKDPKNENSLMFRSASSRHYVLLSDIARMMPYRTINLLNITFPAQEKKGDTEISLTEHSSEYLTVSENKSGILLLLIPPF